MGERTLDQPLTPDEYDDLVRSIGGRSALRRESIMRDLRAHDELLRRRLTDAEKTLQGYTAFRGAIGEPAREFFAAARDRQPPKGD